MHVLTARILIGVSLVGGQLVSSTTRIRRKLIAQIRGTRVLDGRRGSIRASAAVRTPETVPGTRTNRSQRRVPHGPEARRAPTGGTPARRAVAGNARPPAGGSPRRRGFEAVPSPDRSPAGQRS